ncbi:MAG TPA: sigma-70 family RNA polymerase sigma factor [Polyangiaceae bacterium]
MDDESVRRMYLDGTSRWPGVALELEVFSAHCGAAGEAGLEQSAERGAELFLCCACVSGDPRAIGVFEREFLPVARAAITKVQRASDFVEDTLQDFRARLLVGQPAKLATYTGRGPLKAWVRVSAVRAALDRCRALGTSTARNTELSEHFVAPELAAENRLGRARYTEAFQGALHEAVAALPANERNALRMHLCGQCGIEEIGRAYRVHRATAARWLERARTHIKAGVRTALCDRGIDLTESEYVSLARSLASQLELGLSTSAAGGAGPTPAAR